MRCNKAYFTQSVIAPLTVKDKITKHWDSFGSHCNFREPIVLRDMSTGTNGGVRSAIVRLLGMLMGTDLGNVLRKELIRGCLVISRSRDFEMVVLFEEILVLLGSEGLLWDNVLA
ncbi:hypothetical protein G6F46_013375 [Rhizopus delemar]|uniref:Uncharacterized protein n=2 Tax=Rhizopus TaxID=4842 RepID=A0A9P7CAI6_9FUNG|nr:hypothetical protein G6F55_013169 [Rhizopus delemar]KAG1531438.1 hypothetical protein G6F51_013520 [Rhizopus arrhizus]KAG1484886.1 hypothetical protein G6F54_013406 [Rhizopus delemar]KAG1490331.1 hypothetical protein G6F53_013270 [Rhizopus delemar]KAG1491407.1 hypothetical protein G6F52_013476 [Rhizopus delemar]